MIYRFLADLTLALHLAFILFVVLGGLLVAYRPWVIWLHIPAAVYGALISIIGWICPLTPLENRFRLLGAQVGYSDSFIERYLVSLIYPQGLPRLGFVALGVLVLAVNAAMYAWVFRRKRERLTGAPAS